MASPFSESPTQPSNHRWRNRIAWLFLAGLVCRLALVALEPAPRLRGDERTWLALALHQVAAPPAAFDPLRSELLFYPPLHPWLVAAAHVLGGGLVAVKLVQALLGAALVAVVGLVGRRAVGPRAGLVAAAFTACYPILVWYSVHLWSEPLFLVLLWWGLERALAADGGRRGAAVASGLLLGLAALTRELPLYFVPVLAAWLLSRRDRDSLVRAIALVVATTAVVAPWTLRNWVRFDAFVPVSTMGGRALWEGNTTGERGALYAEHDRLVREEGPVAAYRDAMRRGLQSIRQRQPRWILDKAIHQTAGLFTPNNMVLVHIEKRGYGPPRPPRTWMVAVVTLVPYLGVMALFITGLARISWNRPLVLLLLFFLFYVLLHVVVHGHHRFRLPLLPVIFTIGASVVPGVEAVARPWTARRRLVAAALGLAFGACVLHAVSGFLREPAFVGHRASVAPNLGARTASRPSTETTCAAGGLDPPPPAIAGDRLDFPRSPSCGRLSPTQLPACGASLPGTRSDMVTVCAWCQTYMGSKEPLEDPGVTHGICSACMERQTLSDPPVLVVSPARAGTLPLLNTLLRGSPDIAIVVDRRDGERRNGRGNGGGRANGHTLPLDTDRRVDDRRRGPALYLV